MGDLLSRYRQHQERRGLASGTIRTSGRLLKALLEVSGAASLLDVTTDDVEGFLATREIGKRGRRIYLSHLAGFFRWAVDEELTERDPTRRAPRPRAPQLVPRPLATEHIAAALRAAEVPRLRAFLALGAFTGLRCQEIAGLRVEDLDLERQTIIVTAPKGHRQRIVPLHPEPLAALEAHGLAASGYVFRHWNSDKPIQPHTVSHAIADHFRRCGIKGSAHQLRHWYASELYRNTKDLRLTQELLGHASPDTTAGYAAANHDGAAQAVAALSISETTVEETAEVVPLRQRRPDDGTRSEAASHALIPSPAEKARYALRCALACARIPRPAWIPGVGRVISHGGNADGVTSADLEACDGELFDILDRGRHAECGNPCFLVDDGREWIILVGSGALVSEGSRRRWSQLQAAGAIAPPR